MKRSSLKTLCALTLLFSFSVQTAFACTWAVYANGGAAVVARTMDWYSPDDVVVKGHGRGIAVKAAGTPNAKEYTAKYASIQTHSFAQGVVIEGMNEKGLQCSILFLDGAKLPEPEPAKKDVSVDRVIDYMVSNFATVKEAVDSLSGVNIIGLAGLTAPGPEGTTLAFNPKHPPLHFALADAEGGRAIIEMVDGVLKIYQGKEHDAMTNEPRYEVQLYLQEAGYQANGSNLPVDRRARAKEFLADMKQRDVKGTGRTLLAMRGVLATVAAGTEQLDHIENEVYPTIWSVLADLTNKAYYLERYNTWVGEYYDFTMFPVDQSKIVPLTPRVPTPVK